MHTIKEYYKLSLVSYARDNKLHDTPKWKWERHLTKNPKKFIKVSNICDSQTKRHNIKYKYGLNFSWDFKEAIKFYHENGNTISQGAIGKAMAQIKDFHTWGTLKIGSKSTDGHTFLPNHIFSDVKCYLRRKAQLSEGGLLE